ncbi:MAG: amidohydrolase, partial [Gaiellaceae bacterium]
MVGRGWDANDWPEAPHRGPLDALAPDRPVLLHSRDFHALWVNGAALRAAGLSRTSVAAPGGLIERDTSGEPSGVVRENAVRAFHALEQRAATASGDPLALLTEAATALHALGVTGVHDFERGEAAFTLMSRFARGEHASTGARLRVVQCVDPEDLERVAALGLKSGDGDDAFRVGTVKLFADGTLGSRTAAMLEPYQGTSERGLEVLTPADLDQRLSRARAAGFAVAIHAIGDRACRNALDAFERLHARRSGAAPPALADRIEHIQLLAPADLMRFAALGVTASMQPLHSTTDAPLARRQWGSRCQNSYPWRALLGSGAALAFGSDAPV